MLRTLLAFLFVLPAALAADPPVERKMLKNGLVMTCGTRSARPTVSPQSAAPSATMMSGLSRLSVW